jgi:NADH-quinone oxidoreductase subunit B
VWNKGYLARPDCKRKFRWARYPKLYAIVQGVDHVVPVDIYLPGCPPRPEMLMDAILKLHDQIYDEKLGPNREKVIKEVELAAMNAVPTHQLKGLLA